LCGVQRCCANRHALGNGSKDIAKWGVRVRKYNRATVSSNDIHHRGATVRWNHNDCCGGNRGAVCTIAPKVGERHTRLGMQAVLKAGVGLNLDQPVGRGQRIHVHGGGGSGDGQAHE
jgi:hypothetical protein